MNQRSQSENYQRKKPSIKRAEEVYSSIETNSDEDFIGESMEHMIIKTVKRNHRRGGESFKERFSASSETCQST